MAIVTRITKRIVEAAVCPPDKDNYIYARDTEIKGFCVVTYRSGVKSFAFEYRSPEGKTRRPALGKFSSTFTAEQARAKAKKWRRTVESGGDPQAEKEKARNALTVAQILDLYLDSAKFAEKAETTRSTDEGRIKRHLKPTVGKIFIDRVTKEDVRKAFAAIRDGKTACNEKTGPRGRARVKGGEGAARMAIRVLRAVLNWAINEGHCSNNPANGVEIGNDGEREAVLGSVEQYVTLFKTLEQMENEKRIRPVAADCIRVIALTGARRNEIAALRWPHVNLKKSIISLPPSKHKTGKKTGKSRIIGLPAAAVEVIQRQPIEEGDLDGLVFRSAKAGAVISLSADWRKVRKEAEFPDDLVLHSFRHSLGTSMAADGAEAAQIMATLGHKQLSTAQRYIHIARDKRAELAEKSAAHISAALAGLSKSE